MGVAQIEAEFRKHYTKTANKTTEYVSWSDARIRSWLRDHGIAVPMRTNRQELLQRMHENCAYSRARTAASLRRSP